MAKKIFCRIEVEFPISEMWMDPSEFTDADVNLMKETIQEDLLAFIDEIPGGIASYCDFYLGEAPARKGSR